MVLAQADSPYSHRNTTTTPPPPQFSVGERFGVGGGGSLYSRGPRGGRGILMFQEGKVYTGALKWGLKATLCNLCTIVYNCALLSPFWAPF